MFNVIVQLSTVGPGDWLLKQFVLFFQANKLAAKRKAHDDAEKSKKKKARK